jgi:hypothetical protein
VSTTEGGGGPDTEPCRPHAHAPLSQEFEFILQPGTVSTCPDMSTHPMRWEVSLASQAWSCNE